MSTAEGARPVIGPDETAAGVQAWARATIDPGATVEGAWPMPGNAGLSFGCDVRTATAATGVLPLVVRLAPPGVRRRGNTDVLRQVPLLRALTAGGVPVAAVRFATGDPRWFGTDAIVQDRLDALPLHMSAPELSVAPGAGVDPLPYLGQAIDALAAVHAVPAPDGWESPRPPADEIAFWAPLLDRADDPAWRRDGEALRDALLVAPPSDPRVGIFHGDFHTNNVLYDASGALAAIVDWEIAGIGAQLLDLGWLAMFTDPASWHPSHAERMRVVADADWLRARYERATGRDTPRFDWFRALACYRFGAISVLNVRLHRTGKRVDDSWERFALSIGPLFHRGLALLAGESADDTTGER
ncbi:phosphotransferase family protein [Pseudonocardia bannensis]|uniref:Phosphotransferase family protein n=1 Tax=Pseudonocardia bannensis TaxID=630973 RepID=A0A848DMB0_9PSEU|nr:phosphotransferase family protein [Pseudonocardia bannensis]NMH93669.1 phosphotransferase family protein [Pseudonocardia bannensis]